MTRIFHGDWIAQGLRLYGPDPRKWRFKCPACGHVQSAAEVQERHPEIAARGGSQELSVMRWIHYSCEGRLAENPRSAMHGEPDPEQGCDYTSGGLFNLAPLAVIHDDGAESYAFAFADEEPV